MNEFVKKYVKVDVAFEEDGQMRPRWIYWDNIAYPVDRIISIDRAASQRVGGQGDRYLVRVLGKERYLFFEHSVNQMTSAIPGRWFVEAKAQDREEPFPKE